MLILNSTLGDDSRFGVLSGYCKNFEKQRWSFANAPLDFFMVIPFAKEVARILKEKKREL